MTALFAPVAIPPLLTITISHDRPANYQLSWPTLMDIDGSAWIVNMDS